MVITVTKMKQNQIRLVVMTTSIKSIQVTTNDAFCSVSHIIHFDTTQVFTNDIIA